MEGHYICLLFFGPKNKWAFWYFYFFGQKRKPVYGRHLVQTILILHCIEICIEMNKKVNKLEIRSHKNLMTVV